MLEGYLGPYLRRRLLALLERSSAPVWACLLAVAVVLNIPMSWHKAHLSTQVVWIGWHFDHDLSAKLMRLIKPFQALRRAEKCSVKSVPSVCWRRSLASCCGFPLCLGLLGLPWRRCTRTSIFLCQPCLPSQLRASLSAELIVSRPLPLAALPMGAKLLRVSHTPVKKPSDLPISASSCRIWVQIANPSRPERALSPVSRWHELCASGDGLSTALLAPTMSCEAFDNACAVASGAGLGGFVRLPGGRQLCFQHALTPAALASAFPWFPADANPQQYIASWELDAQIALLWCSQRLYLPLHCIFRTDNSSSESACWKGLSMAKGMCVLLRSFFLLQRQFHMSVHLDCVPGFLNVRLRLWVFLQTSVWIFFGRLSRQRPR